MATTNCVLTLEGVPRGVAKLAVVVVVPHAVADDGAVGGRLDEVRLGQAEQAHSLRQLASRGRSDEAWRRIMGMRLLIIEYVSVAR